MKYSICIIFMYLKFNLNFKAQKIAQENKWPVSVSIFLNISTKPKFTSTHRPIWIIHCCLQDVSLKTENENIKYKFTTQFSPTVINRVENVAIDLKIFRFLRVINIRK